MDRLSSLLSHFTLRTGIFYTGNICGIHNFEEDLQQGHLHLIKQGPVRMLDVQKDAVDITEPTLVFLPRPSTHRLVADERTGADVICGTVRFGGGSSNPITDSLPDVVLVALKELPGVAALLDLMYAEAFSGQCGRQAALDRLCEVLMIRLLRHCIKQGLTQGGTLAGLADGRLAKALVAMHENPAHDWQLAEMALMAGMSRARFAVRFREITGETPADYLASWRVMLAQRLLARGRQLKHIAYDVGYGSASALSRAFVRKLGYSPSDWLREQRPAQRSAQDETPGEENETDGALLKARHG